MEQLTNYQLFQLIREEYNWMRAKLAYPNRENNDLIFELNNAFDQIEHTLK